MTFAVDLHTHTRHGSSCSYMEPVDLLRQARLVGLDAVCITEHSVPWDRSSLRDLARGGLPLVFPGMEVSTEMGDVLVFGANGLSPGVCRAEELRALVEGAGGIMIAAHPFRRFFVPGVQASVEEALVNPLFELVDAVEVFNGGGSRQEQEFAVEVVTRLPLPGVAGSDSHAPHTVGCCYTVFERPLATIEDLIGELRSGRVRAVHPSMGLEFGRRPRDMHEPFDPQCGYCAKFVYCFGPESPLADWGFCADEAGDSPPDSDELRHLEELAVAGRYDLLLAAARGLYQVTDDGCSRYRPVVEGMTAPAAAARKDT